MDIEELRARAMASMPNKKKQQSRSQVASAPLLGRSVAANYLLDTNGMQKIVISCAPSATSLNTVHKERKVFLSALHDVHSSARSSMADEKDDNLVIRFSDGESDSDAEDNCLKIDEMQKEGSFHGEAVGSSANQSSAALLQTINTSTSQQTPGMCNQMVMMQKQLAAMRTTMPSAVQACGVASVTCGEGPSWQSSSKRKEVSGQKGLIAQKHSVKPAVSLTKPSRSDLEKLRKQIATKENELKLQRHMKLRKGQGIVSIPNGKVTGPGIAAVPLAGSTGRQLSVSPASSKLAVASEKEMEEEQQKVSQVTAQELLNTSLKGTENNQQQQRKRPLKTDIDDSWGMDGSSNKDLTWDLHPVGSKRQLAGDKLSGRKCLKAAADIDKKNVTDSQLFLMSVQDHCTRMESNPCNSIFNKSMPALTPSMCVISKGLHHTDANDFPEGDGNKKCKMDGSFMGSRNGIKLEEDHSSILYASQCQKHSSVEGFQNLMYIENAEATSKEDEKLEMEVEHKKQVLNQSIKSADIEECSQKNGSGLEQAIVDYLKDVKEGIDGRNVSSTEDGGFNLNHGRQSIGPSCEKQSTRATSGDIPEGAQETRGSTVFPSMEVLKWQGERGPLSTTRPTRNHVLDDLSQLGNICLQDLMKEEDVVDKELEEAQELRNRYETEERLAWKAYRKAQTAVQAASERCLDLHMKRERLSAQVQAVAMRGYSSNGYKDKDQLSKEEFYEPQRLLSHKSQLEGSEQPGCKINERGTIVDYALLTSLKSQDGNNWSSSEYKFQSAYPKSNNRLPTTDVVPNTAKEVYVAYKNGDQGNIYDSVISEIAADHDRDILSCEPKVIFEMRKHQKQMEVKHGVSKESSAKMTEDFERHQMLTGTQHHSRTSLRPVSCKTSENMEICSKSEHCLRREDDISNMINVAEDNDDNHKLIPKLLVIPETLSDEKRSAEFSYINTNILHGKHKYGFHEEKIALLGNTVSSLEKTYVIPENGSNHIEYDGGQQHDISSFNRPHNPYFTYHDKARSASSTERVTSGSVGERSHVPEEDCFVSICKKNTENITLDKTGGSECEQANFKHNHLPQKRKHDNQIPDLEYGLDGLAKFSHTAAKMLNVCVHSSSVIIKTKEECTASPGAETSTESLHGQNYEQDYNIQMAVAKHEQFADPCPQSLEKLLDVPGEVGKIKTIGDLIDDDVNENSVATCHSENSLAGVLDCEKTNHKRCATTLAGLQSSKDNCEEINESFHYSSSVNKDGTTDKENIWKIYIEGQATSGISNGDPYFEQLKQSDFTVLTNSNVSGGPVAAGAANIENQDFMQQTLRSFILRNDAAEKTLGSNFTQTTIQAANTNYCKDIDIQDLCNYTGMASSKLKVIFSYMKDIISTSHVILASSSRQMAPWILQDFADYVPQFLLYESPLNMLKSYRIYNSLNSANGIPHEPITCSYAINPFWPLCKFEHRGKCNNEDCPWQHARDYSLSPSQFLEHLKKYNNTEMDGSFGDYEGLTSHGSDYSQACVVRAAKEAITRGIKISFPVTGEQSVVSEGFFNHITGSSGLKVPVYRIGSHLIKADGLMVGALIAQSTGRFWKLGFCQSFSIPFAIQRLLLPDMPCLSSGAVREWMLGNNSRLPICLYSSSVNPDDSKKHLFRGHEDVECWLELAIDSMNFDSNIDKSDGRKKALCVLSRAIEANPNSVALWAVYLHMFYRKEKVIGKDDMFHHAVHHNKGSYELWLFFINSRLQMEQRLEAYKNAITALCQNASSDGRQDKFSSPYVLDLILQMLNFLSLSGCKLEGITWIEEFVFCSKGSLIKGQPNGISFSTVLSCLTVKDSCVLWVSCMYFRVYGILPKTITERLEFEQTLPFDVEWHRYHLSEESYACTIKIMNKALSSFSESCDQNSPESCLNEDDSLLAVHALVVNHVKCVLELEGLTSAQKLCSHYTKLYPSCIELVLISSSIQSHWGDNRAGIALFEESISNWPQGTPGVQRFWNQFIGYGLKSEGVDLAKDLINRWLEQNKMVDNIISSRAAYSLTCSRLVHTAGDKSVKESMDKGKQTHNFCGEMELDRRCWSQDMMFSLLNLAIYRFLNNDPKETQSAVDQALKAALDDEDVKHCIKEYAALASIGFPDGLETMKNGFDSRMLQLLDKCFVGCQLFPVPNPLSRAFTKKIKKPKVRIFIENLLGPIPLDCSLLNLILETWYGPSLLPEKLDTFKDLVDFVEGVLELTPVNLKLVLSVFRVIVQRCNSQSISCIAAFFWASSLLINSIFQSFPVAPENTWLEVGDFLESLGAHVILEEFYQQALSIHPFSVALWRSFLNFRQQTENLTGVIEAAKQRGIIID